MEHQHHDQLGKMSADAAVLPQEPPANTDDGAAFDEDVAPFLHGAETVQIDLAPYSLTREQVAERYTAAGLSVKPRTVSLYAQQGRLRARKVEAKNGLERYLFDPASIDDDIAKRRQGADSYAAPETVYATANGAGTAHERGSDSAYPLPAPSLHGELHAKEIRVAVLETELRMERDARVRAERRAEQEGNRSLALAQQLGEFKQRVAMLEAPKEDPATPEPEPEPEPDPTPTIDDAKPRASFLRRLFGGT
jgi:hypothetical protein